MSFEISKIRHCAEAKLKKVRKTIAELVEVLTGDITFHVPSPPFRQSPNAEGIHMISNVVSTA